MLYVTLKLPGLYSLSAAWLPSYFYKHSILGLALQLWQSQAASALKRLFCNELLLAAASKYLSYFPLQLLRKGHILTGAAPKTGHVAGITSSDLDHARNCQSGFEFWFLVGRAAKCLVLSKFIKKMILDSHPAHAGTSVARLVRLASKESFLCHPRSMDKHQVSHKQHRQALAGSKPLVSTATAANFASYFKQNNYSMI